MVIDLNDVCDLLRARIEYFHDKAEAAEKLARTHASQFGDSSGHIVNKRIFEHVANELEDVLSKVEGSA